MGGGVGERYRRFVVSPARPFALPFGWLVYYGVFCAGLGVGAIERVGRSLVVAIVRVGMGMAGSLRGW